MENIKLYKETNDRIADLLLLCEDNTMCLYAGTYIKSLEEKIKNYEDLEKQGKLPKLRVPIGTLVYEPYQFMEEGAWEIDVHKIRLEDLDKIGKTVFLTIEEAEAALKELERGKGE